MNERILRFDEINLRNLFMTVLRNLWVVGCICLSAVMIFTASCKLNWMPQYTSSATLMVGAKDSTSAYNSLTTTQSMAAVFSEVFRSNVLRSKIQEQLGDETFDGTVTTNIIPETNLLIVSVTSPSPEMSFRALGLIIENHASISDYLFANAQLEVIKDPVVPVSPSNPLNYRKSYPLILILSACVTLFVMVLICILRDSVQTPAAARRKLDAQLLRTVHHEKQRRSILPLRTKKSAPLITGPLISRSFLEDNMSLCSAVEYHMRKRRQKVILVTSAGENEGKSTISANLALALAAKGKRVVLLDCDFRKPSLHKIFETPVTEEAAFSTGLLDRESTEAAKTVELKKLGLSVGFSQANHKHIHGLLNNGRLQQVIGQLRKTQDYIVLDTPPMLVAADAETIAQLADTAMVVVRSNFMLAATVNDCLDKLRKTAPEVCGIVLNNYQ